ncbi:uncharacterized protein LOC123293207 [Chrysoperla carnea]|uniref:uncharacterized protein LOC123293207 n=1 Tax=Chrysoperla carnea TaxID=189513 RepID=UPI001D06FF9D|nr:uncharacterized protein LOC123293207 [Chrysoperla carnea]
MNMQIPQIPKFAKIGVCWAAITGAGVYAFILSKRDIERKRFEHMKARERMRKSNIGEYEQSARKF